jgi:transglutaminase-like putative cysteine protease
VYKNIDYKLTPKRIKNPQETLDDGKGDCADMTLLLMAIMNYQYNIKSEYVVVNTKKKGIKHAYMKYNGYYYDCTNGEKSRSYPEEHFQTLNYYQAMAVCYLN